jgi:hypothetical protein
MVHQTNAAMPAPYLRHAGCTDQCGTFTPEDDSPPELWIGSRASDERIERLAVKHGFDPRTLIYFARNGKGGGTHG